VDEDGRGDDRGDEGGDESDWEEVDEIDVLT
jgi:hypothetical protein